LAIMEGPIPVVKPADEERLLQSDRELQEKLDDCPCRGKTNDGRPCSKDNPCGNCEVRRRYLALLLHRERYGRVKHPSEGYVNYVNSFDPPEDGVDSDQEQGDRLITLTPPALDSTAYHGFVGEFLRAVAPYTEATDAGVLAHFLPAIGMFFGPGPYVWAGGKQPARLNTVLVGPTSVGRKGTSKVPVDLLMNRLATISGDRDFWANQCLSGLSSGEGLIQKVS